MKTQSSLNHQLHEGGGEKQTLLEKYIEFWTEERDEEIERPEGLIEDITVSSSKKVSPTVMEEYKKFLLEFKYKNEQETSIGTNEQLSLNALNDLITNLKSPKKES